ncbi:DUF6515 family protein [Pseudomonas sp. KNUC1026]|uniref:DUF6515 family protein n=1 Tax=Pseudomonas sp. KNUC1026 TaxID=2893890 RepID=UPI001F3666D7|nr:DUF6515 family protein [Pseudomonas sp. KNUC1026]UFH48878.1 glycine zipper family protein [Pseudomonas sp. KNUC1026]
MNASMWRLASAGLLSLCIAGHAQADTNGPPGMFQDNKGPAGRFQQTPTPQPQAPRPSQPAPQQPPQQPVQPQQRGPMGRFQQTQPPAPQPPSWQANPYGGQPQPGYSNGNPLQPHPDSVRQTEPPIRGDYRDLQPQNRRYEAGGPGQRRGDDRWGPPRGNGWGPGPRYRPGQMIDRFPGQNWRVPYGGRDFYYSGGYWYQPQAGRYVVVTPPYGIRTRALPDYATRTWIGGSVFFLAAGTWYQWMDNEQDYVVVNPPANATYSEPVPAQPVASNANTWDVQVYPSNGQSLEQLERDRFECQQWATQQSGFDPRAATYAPADAVVYTYRQTLANCLVTRGYGVN